MARPCMSAVAVLLSLSGLSAVRAAVRVDLNPNCDRRDILTEGWENWSVPDGQSASQKFGDVRVTLRPAANQPGRVGADWWKQGFDTQASLASDGVLIKDGQPGAPLELVLSGLKPGQHSVVMYHNSLWAGSTSAYDFSVNGKLTLTGFQPSSQVTNDYDTAAAYLEFVVQSGKDVVIHIKPNGAGQVDKVVLNAFEIDGLDPNRRARKPVPFDGDEHTLENPVLTWTPAKTAIAQRVYFGLDRAAVENATPASAEFQGEQQSAAFATSGLNHAATYYWRVDQIHADRPLQATRGEVWSFRVRHLAFPGAEGYGQFARGGRGGRVIEVTNLDDSGPGSLRAAVEAEGPRTVVFRVGGTIELKSKLKIHNPYITIAGQTAPGDGITIRGYPFGCCGAHDVIMRYVRIRVGDESGRTLDGTGFCSSDHSILDHCSISWSIDEAVSSRSAKNITLQRCLIAQALNVAGHEKYAQGKGHSFAASISGEIGSFHHNLVAHCAGRCFSLAGGLTRGGKFSGQLDIRNNVVYNWKHRTNDGGVKALNLVANYYIPGPATQVFRLLEPDTGKPEDPQHYHVSGNIMEGRPEFDADNWKNGGVKVASELASSIKLAAPFCESFVTTQTALEAYHDVLADVGANWPKLDSVDRSVLSDVRARSFTYRGSKTGLPGIIDSQKDVGGWPVMASGVAPEDSDHDGMPDDWEIARGLEPTDPADGSQDAGDGYTNLEHYLNGIIYTARVEDAPVAMSQEQ